MRRILAVLALALSCSAALAGQQFTCGAAQVSVSTEANVDPSQDFARAGVLSVERDGHQTMLQYRGNVDFLGATCMLGKHDQPKVLFQAFCEGSGCHDYDNWGIIDATSLRVELIPSDTNRQETQDRLGGRKPCVDLLGLHNGKLIPGNCQ